MRIGHWSCWRITTVAWQSLRTSSFVGQSKKSSRRSRAGCFRRLLV